MRILTLGLILVWSAASQAAEINGTTGTSWASYRDLSSQRFSEKFEELSDRGYRMTDVEAYHTSGGMRYAMIWERNTDGRGWAERRDMTSQRYHERWVEYRDRGFRPTDIEGYMNGNRLRFAGVWVENREDIRWSSWRNMTSSSYGDRFTEMSGRGYMLVDMEAYDTPDGLRYAAIWYENEDNIPWAQYRNMSRQRYQERVDDFGSRGYKMVDYERYERNGQTQYAAIWHKTNDLQQRSIRTNRSEKDYANLFQHYRDDGYRPVDFERDGSRYGAIWAKSNLTQANYQHRSAFDDLLQDYRTDNSIAGISAAVVHNGQVVWQGGFGKTDLLGNKDAHGHTVYKLASISKAVGGTLLGRFEEAGERQNGAPVNMSGADLIRDHLPMLPSRYGQTLAQLASHTGCIPHYDTSPSISNQTTHYDTQLAATLSISGNPLLDNCAIGDSRSYSTHAFTYLGAAMEEATGRSVFQLVRDELANEHGLLSLRMMYGLDGLADDNNRTALFSGDIVLPRFDNSWKAFGGGLESNPVDLARFGWLTGDGRITSVMFRDSTLMAPQPNSWNAYGWSMTNRDGRRIASHGGGADGAVTQLTVWPDHDLSIAIMSNQRGHDGLFALTQSMATIALGVSN